MHSTAKKVKVPLLLCTTFWMFKCIPPNFAWKSVHNMEQVYRSLAVTKATLRWFIALYKNEKQSLHHQVVTLTLYTLHWFHVNLVAECSNRKCIYYMDYCCTVTTLVELSLCGISAQKQAAKKFASSWKCRIKYNDLMKVWFRPALGNMTALFPLAFRSREEHLQFSLVWNIQRKQWPPWATSLFKGHVVHLRLQQDERLR